MTYDRIVAGLIKWSLEHTSINSHERVLFRRYSPDQASQITRCLLERGGSAIVGSPQDDGTIASMELPAVRWTLNSRTIEVLPYVVTGETVTGEPAWLGSQGFASRLRTAFHLLVPPDTIRVLILFDQHPVETEETTASEYLAASMDSLDTLMAWMSAPEQGLGFATQVSKTALAVVRWWREKIRSEPTWTDAPHVELIEQAATFMAACRPLGSRSEIGPYLPCLGLFVDSALPIDSQLPFRLADNANRVAELESLRRQRVVDPVREAETILDLGPPDDEFHSELAAGLRSHSRPVTDAKVTLQQIEDRLRTRDQRPAWLDVARLEAVGLDRNGTASGPVLPWRLIRRGELPPVRDTVSEIAVPCPADGVRITFSTAGNLRAFLYEDGNFASQADDADGGMIPGRPLSRDFARPNPFRVVKLVLYDKKRGRGRPPRPTQIVHIGLVAGDRIVAPEDAWLDPDPARQAFVVDGAADHINVQVGGVEVDVTTNLPDTNGQVSEVTVDGVTFRWAGEDRTPVADPAPRRTTRLLECVGIREAGNPHDYQPYYTVGGGLAATCGSSATLDVDAQWLRDEAELLLHPERFVGLSADNEAAAEELKRVVPGPFQQWLSSRVSFFDAVRDSCERGIPNVGRDRPTMYLANLRDDQLATRAKEYITNYCALLRAVSAAAADAPKPALIEHVLLCDSAASDDGSLRLSPTHPVAVALLGSLQRGLLNSPWPAPDDRESTERLLARPLLSGVLPWIRWRGRGLEALQFGPLLWRCYGTDGGTLDRSHELRPVVVQKIKRLLSLAPHLNDPNQYIHVNVEIGRGAGDYLVEALRDLEGDDKVSCAFDVGVVCSDGATEPALTRLFANDPQSQRDAVRERLFGRVRICRLRDSAERPAHLVFRMEAANAEKELFASTRDSLALIRETGFCGGLSEEPARVAVTSSNDVHYTRYVAAGDPDASLPPLGQAPEGSWDGEWRRLFRMVCRLSQRSAVGLHAAIGPDSIPCQRLRQIADGQASRQYNNSFITVHCDPAQGPEFFVGARTVRSGVFLVECSDRGAPELPGRDIVSVTSRIGPFRAALSAAVRNLPPSMRERVVHDEEVTKGLLRDINLLRGTEVFHFLREVSRDPNRDTGHVYLMDGLDNVLALRFLLSDHADIPGLFPVVVALRDFVDRCAPLEALKRGIKCDDIIVFYLARPEEATPVLLYRLVEVKFGPRRERQRKAQQQLSETARKLTEKLPLGRWCDEPSPTALLLERDLVWTIHEVLERYRAFGLLPDDDAVERHWGLRELFSRVHRGDFELRPYSAQPGIPVSGTGLMLDPDIPGRKVTVEVDQAIEYVTVPRDLIADLLTAHVHEVPGSIGSSSPSGHASVRRSLPAANTAELVSAVPASDATTASPQAAITEADGAETTARLTEHRHETPSRSTHQSADLAREMAQERIGLVFDGFVGNTGTVTRLKRALIIANLEHHRWLEPTALFGPKSTGKTELANRIARALDVRKIELSETLLKSADDLAKAIQVGANEVGTPLRVEVRDGARILPAPPMVIFIDEIHLLKARVQDSLLKALEPADRLLLSTIGTIDTRQVTFIIATTDPGELREPFKSRVARYELREYTLDELVLILDAHRTDPDIPPVATEFTDEALRIIARVGRQVPRQALRLMRDTAREVAVGLVGSSADDLSRHYWDQQRADETGLTDRDRAYVRLLFPDRVIGLDALAAQLGEGQTTITTDIEPYLLRLGLIERGRSGRSLTQGGRELVPRMAR